MKRWPVSGCPTCTPMKSSQALPVHAALGRAGCKRHETRDQLSACREICLTDGAARLAGYARQECKPRASMRGLGGFATIVLFENIREVSIVLAGGIRTGNLLPSANGLLVVSDRGEALAIGA
ncbi:MAG: hypothetical protein C0511_14605 [Hyphomicrobium sp.]|nr:hypothetical protein [Hyphomicrobium sp.]